jgi:tol-pal system protein YbgF
VTEAPTSHEAGELGVRWLVPLVVTLLIAGCASRGSVSKVRDDLGSLRAEVTELRTSHEAAVRDLARLGSQSRALEARLAEVFAAQKTTAAAVARLEQRVDAAEAAAREAKTLVSVPPVSAPPRAPSVAPPVSPAPPVSSGPPPAPLAPPRAPLAPPPAPLAPPRAPSPLVTPPAPSAPPAATAPPVTPSVLVPPKESQRRVATPERVYSAALATFRAREHGQAVLDFLDFIAKYPRHPLVANAQYWIGEAYYVQHDYRQAQTEFQKVLDIAPGSPKAADALLKIGYCQLNLRDTTRARAAWQRVVQEFPKSEAAAKARALLTGPGSASIR